MNVDEVGSALGPTDPTSLGPWQVLRRLGQGGMGSVYLCADDSGRLAAVKTVNTWLTDLSVRARFRREVAISAKVSGPQVADVLGYDLDASTPWLALRFVPGPTLAEVLGSRGALSDVDLQSLAVGLMQGLVLIHAVGITHRDLKPGNIIWHENGPVIIDFGISRSEGGTAITGTAQAIGTAGWMSPEQILGHPPAPSSDVFSWAAVVAYASTGRPPFGAGTVESLTYRVIHAEPELSGVPNWLRPVLGASLRKNPHDRPDCATVLSALAGNRVALKRPTVPTAAVPDVPTALQVESYGQRRGVVITLGLVAASAVLGLAIGGIMIVLGRDASDDAGETTDPPRTSDASDGAAPSEGSAADTTNAAASPEPRLALTIVPYTDDVDELTTFLAENQQQVVLLDLVVAAPAGGDVEDAVYYVPDAEPANFTVRPGGAYGGVELVLHDFSSTPDASMFWMRGEIYLQGRFAVQGSGGMHQGVESFGLRALPLAATDPGSPVESTTTSDSDGSSDDDAVGGIQVGMTSDEVIDSGGVSDRAWAQASVDQEDATCLIIPMAEYDGQVWFHQTTDAVAAIEFGPSMETPAGVGVGDSKAALQDAYPDLERHGFPGDWRYPIASGIQYFFSVDYTGAVAQIFLEAEERLCYG